MAFSTQVAKPALVQILMCHELVDANTYSVRERALQVAVQVVAVPVGIDEVMTTAYTPLLPELPPPSPLPQWQGTPIQCTGK